MSDAEKEEKKAKNAEQCLAWIEKSTLPEREKVWCRQEVAKGEVFVAYGTLCKYQEGGPYDTGLYTLWGSMLEW
jgi:hypothetical protein